MSQRTFRQGNLEVFTGWDRPLQYFFLVIERLDATDDDEDEGYTFSNLRRRNPGMTLDEIVAVLAQHGIEPPASFVDDMNKDKERNAGNEEYHYGSHPEYTLKRIR